MGKNSKEPFVDPNLFLDPIGLLEWAVTGKPTDKIKQVQTSCVVDHNFTLMDISLNSHGFDEDELYAKDLLIRNNIRRGNSLLVQSASPSEPANFNKRLMKRGMAVTDVWFVRRGMHKFFDMYPEFTYQQNTKNLNLDGSFVGNFPIRYNSNDSTKEQLRRIIFYEVEQAILTEKVGIDVYKSDKANGENAQISYSRIIDAWIIASKNVSIAARNEEDLNIHTLDRFLFAKLIGIE